MIRNIKFIFLSALILRIVLAFVAWHPDINNHVDWGIRFFEYGPSKFYAPESNVWNFTWPNQPPGTILTFAIIRKLFEFVFSIFWTINIKVPAFPSQIITFFEDNLYIALLKLPAILGDLGIAYIIYRFFNDRKKTKAGILGAALFLFNPVIWYNSSIWGQTDSYINFFAILSFYLLLRRKITWAFLALAISFYIKISLFIFLPVFLIAVIKQKYEIKQILKAIILPLVVIGILTLPFSGGEPFSWLVNIYQTKVLTQQLHVITANAFNLWAAVAGIHERPNSLFLGPLTYQTWGVILFAVTTLPVLYLLFKKFSEKTLIWTLALTSFGSFVLLTNMHERYLYPLFPYFTILAVNNRRLLPLYWLTSGINLVNLYNFWWFPRLEPLVSFLSIGDRLMPRILGLVNVGILGKVYSVFLRQNSLKNI